MISEEREVRFIIKMHVIQNTLFYKQNMNFT